MNLEIESRNIAMTPRWKNEIEARMADLQHGHEDIIHGRVTLTKNRHHKKLAKVAEALVLVTIPKRRTVTAHKIDKTFEEAIRAAFEAVAIELRKFREKRATKVIRREPLPDLRGVVSKLFPRKGYGFILQDGGGEVYFHKNAVKGIAFTELEDGSEVLFSAEPGDKGLHATVVQPPPAGAAI
ncbi:MAG: HPF/RaiA family ribosome-associated protein [Nitrospiraceae bacterium]|nr:HPF/RaiA family ribosome-associated protein [Nitrospiraceae bacterium]